MLKHEVSDLSAFISGHWPALANNKFVDLHKPNIMKLVLVKVDIHAKQIVTMNMLEIEADHMAHFQAVLERILFSEHIVILTELTIVKLYFAVE